MHRFLLSVILLLSSVAVLAQQTSSSTAALLEKKPSRNPDLEGIVLTYHADFLRGFPASPANFREGRSGGVTIAFFANQRLGKSRFSFAEGVGISTRHYFSNIQDWTVAGTFYPDSPEVKNKHMVTTIDLPLEFRFTTREKGNLKPFKMVVGFNFGYVIGFRHKRTLGNVVNITSGDASNRTVNPWRPAFTARIGYHRMAISGYYGITELFGDGAAYRNIRPWSVGISLTL